MRHARLTIRLNDAQRDAVQTVIGPLLCIAGAGTGKTATLTARVASMIESGIQPENILLLTFTRKAAEEMLERAAKSFDVRCYAVEGGTFHSFANRLLRVHGDLLGLRHFNIIDQADSEDIIRMQLDALGMTGKDSEMPSARTVRSIFSKQVNWGMSLPDIIKREYNEYVSRIGDLQTLWDEVDWYKVVHGLIDYDDLLIQALRLLRDFPDMCSNLSWHHRYIMVDEYQDTNSLQAEMVRLLACEHDNVMAVGDDAQSIYAFRGANYRNILDFPTQFPSAKIVRLEQNFRSVQPILDLTNQVIAQAKESFRKTLYSQRTSHLQPHLVTCWDEQAQSQYVVDAITRLRKKGTPLSDIAVLIRSGFMSYDLELELNAAKIPFVKVGGLKFLEARHIKDILAYLRVLVNVKDTLAWFRILTMLKGVGAKTAQRIYDELEKQEWPYGWLAECPFKGKWQDDVRKLGCALEACMKNAWTTVDKLDVLIAYYLPFLREAEDSDREYVRRQQGLEHLADMADHYENLIEFLSNVTLDPPNEASSRNNAGEGDSDDNSENDVSKDVPEDVLTISTIHSAKGLEWKHVFVLWLTEGRFPSLYAYEDDDRLEEELRLLYVAMTRAKDSLHLCNPAYFDRRAGMTFSQVSSYLKDMSADLYHAVTVGGTPKPAVAVPVFG